MTARAVSNAVLQNEVQHLSAKVDTLTKTIEQLVEVDLALRLFIRAVKWAAGVVAAGAAVWATWRGH